MPIDRRLLREQVREDVLDRLFKGEYPVGTRINEVHLAAEIGVSRTPLREVLVSLAGEGILEARPNRGFWLSALTEREVRETYPIIAQLEVLALSLSDPDVLAERAPELGELAQKMALAADGQQARQADDEWHGTLLEPCPNRRLLEMISDTKRIVHRYEHAYFDTSATLRESADQHKRIAVALQRGELERALEELESNWKTSMHRLIARISGPSDGK
jgi:DNA-binding GntR family transcriptional regulator